MNGKNVWVICMACNFDHEAQAFANEVTDATRKGFEIESSGINTLPSGYSKAWAILTKPEKED